MFSLSLVFRDLIMMCLGMIFLVFILLGVYWTSGFLVFIKFGKISSNIYICLSFPFSETLQVCLTIWCSTGHSSFFWVSFHSWLYFDQFLLLCFQVSWSFSSVVSNLHKWAILKTEKIVSDILLTKLKVIEPIKCSVCRGLIKNGERQDEESLGGRRRTDALRFLCKMNPSQALKVRGMVVRDLIIFLR